MVAHCRSDAFRNARLAMHGGSITQVTGDQIIYNSNTGLEARKQEGAPGASLGSVVKETKHNCFPALKRLFKHIAPGALHDSAERRDPPKCHPHTREAIQREILTWAQNPYNHHLLMWIYGPAGSGKSAIMQTISERCEELDILGGSFFFLHTAERRNVGDFLIPTLAYQLAKTIPRFEDLLMDTILENPAVFSKHMASQMKALILDPMAAAVSGESHSTQRLRVILVDGLDECNEEASQREIIKLLSSSASPQLRFIIASRPELSIRDSFSIPDIENRTEILALNEHYLPFDDIRQFLEDKFENIKTNHLLRHSLPHNWPGSSAIDTLVENSSGQFIYAVTVMRYIESPRHSPIEHLTTVLRTELLPEQSDTPFALLDSLYHRIFASVADVTAVLDILRVVLSDVEQRLDNLSLYIEALLGYSPGWVQLLLCDMHSLLKLERTNDEKYLCIRLCHKSLADFLFDPLRSRHLYIDLKESTQFIGINLFNRFSGEQVCRLYIKYVVTSSI